MESPQIVRVKTEEEVINNLCELIEAIANKAIESEDVFKIGLSGGSLVNFLATGLPKITTDWSKWRLFFCDERVVPSESPDSTFGAYRKSLIGSVPLSENQFIQIDPHLTGKFNGSHSKHSKSQRLAVLPHFGPEDAARDYIRKMALFFAPDSLPRFDVLLLGMGPDGHTCSLFPGHRLLDETSVWIAPITNSPKPPPSRITLTFPIINNAENCIFAISGQGKAEMVKRILKDKEDLPAGRVKPADGKLYWILDEGASSLL
ncbi:6-phosphogluconolactonase [Frankliniella fusca]|uniref:6-phosphogluconolactonase n=1 Tax=Frankliniella fusca TaxID=407009 RepID=A0AAE1LJS0_9NEOP|nr:6-phosphogluconolactonase [Frankliniella fusca]